MKEAATCNKGMMRPVLEYGSSVWDPHTQKPQDELEKVQNHAARFVTEIIFMNSEYDWHAWTIEIGIP